MQLFPGAHAVTHKVLEVGQAKEVTVARRRGLSRAAPGRPPVNAKISFSRPRAKRPQCPGSRKRGPSRTRPLWRPATSPEITRLGPSGSPPRQPVAQQAYPWTTTAPSAGSPSLWFTGSSTPCSGLAAAFGPRSSRLRRPEPASGLGPFGSRSLAPGALRLPAPGALPAQHEGYQRAFARDHRRQPDGMARAPAMAGRFACPAIAGARALQPFTHTFARITRRRP